MGDLLTDMRRRKCCATGSAAATPAVEGNGADVETLVPPEADEPSPVVENEGSLSDEEHDLGTPEGCQNYILCCFSKGRRAEIAPVAAFYVSTHLKPMCTKKIGLWEVFNKLIVGTRVLHSTAGRNSWLSAWKANREKRFAKVVLKSMAATGVILWCVCPCPGPTKAFLLKPHKL